MREVKDFPNYMVTKEGKIISKLTGKPKKERLRSGYTQVSLSKNGKKYHKLLHRLVYDSFIGIPEGLVVDHIDNNKQNNALSNLEAMTQKDNINKKFVDFPCPTLVNKDGDKVKVTLPYKDFAASIGVQYSNLCMVLKGKRKTTGGWSVYESHNEHGYT